MSMMRCVISSKDKRSDMRPEAHPIHDNLPRRVAIIVPAQHVVDGAGAAAVFAHEIELFKKRRWHVTLFVVSPSLKLRAAPRTSWAKRVELGAMRLGADEIRLVTKVRFFSGWLSVLRLVWARLLKRVDLTVDLAVSDVMYGFALKPATIPRPDLVVCNYLSGLAVADALAGRGQQLIVLHDVIVHELSARVVKELQDRPHIVTLSAANAEEVQMRIPGLVCQVGIPFRDDRPLQFGEIQGYRNLANAIDSCNPAKVPSGGWSQSEWAAHQSMDLLFVGGTHRPNIQGLACFVEECFLPYLQPHGVRLVVAGDIGPALWQSGQEPPGVTVLGRVDNLRPLYASSKLIIVPLLTGSGLSIKTVEAVALGKPVLASTVGLRGLGVAQSLALAPPFDRRWADQIISLLASRVVRRSHRDALRASLHLSTLDDILDNVIRSRLDTGSDDPIRIEPAVRNDSAWPLVDWFDGSDGVWPLLADPTLPPKVVVQRLTEYLRSQGFGTLVDCEDLATDLQNNKP